ncbi:MAG: hypothetical protein K2Z81_01245 [Cyanobacteria bacterium]|nr:hypothetical protein [Cyanobacteriota bacterium]
MNGLQQSKQAPKMNVHFICSIGDPGFISLTIPEAARLVGVEVPAFRELLKTEEDLFDEDGDLSLGGVSSWIETNRKRFNW